MKKTLWFVAGVVVICIVAPLVSYLIDGQWRMMLSPGIFFASIGVALFALGCWDFDYGKGDFSAEGIIGGPILILYGFVLIYSAITGIP